MGVVSFGRALGVLLAGVVVAIGAFIALSALGVMRQSVSLSMDSGLLSPSFLVMLIPFTAWSYGLRVFRWHTLVRRLVPDLPLTVSGYTQVVGFAFSASPGRVAELYKLKLLERSTRIPVAQSLPAAIVERITDAAAFGLLVVIGGIFNWSDALDQRGTPWWLVLLTGLTILTLVGYASRRQPLARRLARSVANVWATRIQHWARIVPGFNRVTGVLTQLGSGSSKVISPVSVGIALACVILGRLGDGIILYQIARTVGYPVPYSMALIMIGSAGLAGGITLAPGGFGTTEATLVGLIVARGAPLGVAMVTAFGARALIFWFWVILGLLVFIVTHSKPIMSAVGLGARTELIAKE